MTSVYHVLPHSAVNRDARWDNVTDGWHARLGRAIQEHSNYSVECWTVDHELSEQYCTSEGGITYRAFPSFLPPGTNAIQRAISPIVGSYADEVLEITPALLRAIRSRLSKEQNPIFHFHSDTYLNTYLVTLLFSGARLYLQHHGGLRGLPRLERRLFGAFDHIFTLTPEKKQYFTRSVGLPEGRVTVQTMGVDTAEYRPGDDRGVRNEIGSDYLLYVGKYDSYKGLDEVFAAFERVRETEDVQLVLLGGSQSDDLYDEARKTSGVHPITDYVSDARMISYYRGASVFTSYPGKSALEAGDCGIISPVESVACGTPIVTPVLRFFPPDDRNRVGRLPETNEELRQGIVEWLHRDVDPGTLHGVAERDFSWGGVAETVVDRYESVE